MFKLLGLMVLIVASASVYLYFSMQKQGDPPSTTMPANAKTVDSAYMTPWALVTANMTDSMDFTDHWLTGRGWSGDVFSVETSGKFRTFSIRDEGLIPGVVVIVQAEASKDMARAVRKGGFVRFTGRIAEIILSEDPVMVSQRIVMDSVTVHEAR